MIDKKDKKLPGLTQVHKGWRTNGFPPQLAVVNTDAPQYLIGRDRKTAMIPGIACAHRYRMDLYYCHHDEQRKG